MLVTWAEDQSVAGPLFTQPPRPGNLKPLSFINGVAVLVLAIGLFAQVVPSTWIILMNTIQFSSWALIR